MKEMLAELTFRLVSVVAVFEAINWKQQRVPGQTKGELVRQTEIANSRVFSRSS